MWCRSRQADRGSGAADVVDAGRRAGAPVLVLARTDLRGVPRPHPGVGPARRIRRNRCAEPVRRAEPGPHRLAAPARSPHRPRHRALAARRLLREPPGARRQRDGTGRPGHAAAAGRSRDRRHQRAVRVRVPHELPPTVAVHPGAFARGPHNGWRANGGAAGHVAWHGAAVRHLLHALARAGLEPGAGMRRRRRGRRCRRARRGGQARDPRRRAPRPCARPRSGTGSGPGSVGARVRGRRGRHRGAPGRRGSLARGHRAAAGHLGALAAPARSPGTSTPTRRPCAGCGWSGPGSICSTRPGVTSGSSTSPRRPGSPTSRAFTARSAGSSAEPRGRCGATGRARPPDAAGTPSHLPSTSRWPPTGRSR